MAQQTEVKTAHYSRRGAAGTLTLSGSVDIFEAQAVYTAAQRALADPKAVSLCADLSEVQRLDLSALQILCALRRDLEAAGRTVQFQMPDTLAAAVARAGISL